MSPADHEPPDLRTAASDAADFLASYTKGQCELPDLLVEIMHDYATDLRAALAAEATEPPPTCIDGRTCAYQRNGLDACDGACALRESDPDDVADFMADERPEYRPGDIGAMKELGKRISDHLAGSAPDPQSEPVEHGFKSGGWASGFYRVFCRCGHKSVGADSATAHAYWHDHMAEVRSAEVPDGL